MARLLIIDDEVMLAKNLARFFERAGHTVALAHDGQTGIETTSRINPDLVIVDFQLPDMDGLKVIQTLRTLDPHICAVMVSGHANVSIAVDAMKAGYIDLLTKPISLEHIGQVVDKALAESENRRALAFYHNRNAIQGGLNQLIGQSTIMAQLRAYIATIACNVPQDHSPPPAVLITGETGTGKELIARACHFAGPRANKPFVDINCAALPAHLIEAELFGFEKGAFTDAKARKIGLIESAQGGTLFLDEIGELDLAVQAKLLRVLEGSRVRRLGALQDTAVNVRFVAATNRPLEQAVANGQFRGDLLYRLGVLTVESPALRNRDNDVIELAHFFAAQFSKRYAKPVPQFSESALEALRLHTWPGNVRELKNLVERVILLGSNPEVGVTDLGLSVQLKNPAANELPLIQSAPQSLESLERNALMQALQQTGWNVTQSAKLLGISRDTLRYRIEKFEIHKTDLI